MGFVKKNTERQERRKLRVRSRLKLSLTPRISVFRSLNHIYVQLIDDSKQNTLASCSSLELGKLKGDKKAIAFAVGKELAARAKKAGVEKAVFDRGHFLYHGRVKLLADGLREGGLKI
jgi:large subunit ribosomal protein L18